MVIQTPKVIVPYHGLRVGETAAIALAKEIGAEYLIMDEKLGRKVASREGLTVIGTVGILEIAAKEGLLDLAAAFAQLIQTDFRVAPEFLDSRLLAFERYQS